MRTEKITSSILPWKRPRWESPQHNNTILLVRGMASLAILGMGLPWVRQAKWLQGGVAAAGLGGVALQIKCHREMKAIRARCAYVGNDPSWPPAGTGSKWDDIADSPYQGYVYGEDGQRIPANPQTTKLQVPAPLILAIEAQIENDPSKLMQASNVYCFAKLNSKYYLLLKVDGKLYSWNIKISDRAYEATCTEQAEELGTVRSLNLNGFAQLIFTEHNINAQDITLFKNKRSQM